MKASLWRVIALEGQGHEPSGGWMECPRLPRLATASALLGTAPPTIPAGSGASTRFRHPNVPATAQRTGRDRVAVREREGAVDLIPKGSTRHRSAPLGCMTGPPGVQFGFISDGDGPQYEESLDSPTPATCQHFSLPLGSLEKAWPEGLGTPGHPHASGSRILHQHAPDPQ